MIANFPRNTKYAYQNTVYLFVGGKIITDQVQGWKVNVSNPSNDGITPQQRVLYNFINRPLLWVSEKLVFASLNDVRGYIRQDYFNRAIESGSGGNGIFRDIWTKINDSPNDYGTWADWAWWDMENGNFNNFADKDPANIINVVVPTAELVVDNCNLKNATLPTDLDTVDEMIAAVKSYHKHKSIWTDAKQFWRYAATGTVAIANGDATVTGTGTAFKSELIPGDEVKIGSVFKTVLSVTDDTHFEASSNYGSTSSGNALTVFPADRIF